jgi:NAD-dependent dihydropyrimidine dehydrogenase PreA subunit
MSIKQIDTDLCTGCGICVNSCPMDVIRMDEANKKALIMYPEDCMLCIFCERDCPQGAIYVSPEKVSPMILSWG